MGVGYEQKDYLQVFQSLIYYLLHLPNEKKNPYPSNVPSMYKGSEIQRCCVKALPFELVYTINL